MMAGIPGMIETPAEINLVLDPGIRAFVLIPIFLVVLMRNLLQQSIAKVVKSKPVVTQKDRIQHAQSVRRSKRTRGNCHWIPTPSFARRRRFLTQSALKAVELAKAENGAAPEQNIDDVTNMMSMMKGNTASYISNIGFMFWVNSFFAGFLLVRLPFAMPETLLPLVQRDIGLQSFDCSYVSSLSWYFISFFGLSGLNKLLLSGGHEDPDMKMMREQMSGASPMPGMMPGGGGGGMPGMGGQYDPNSMLSQERNELKIVRHNWACNDSEKRLLKKWNN